MHIITLQDALCDGKKEINLATSIGYCFMPTCNFESMKIWEINQIFENHNMGYKKD